VSIFQIEPLRKRSRRFRSVIYLTTLTLFLFVYSWTMEAIPQAHISPQSEPQDILPILEQTQITDNQLNILSGQTGLHPGTIQKFLNQGKTQLLLQLQQCYFAPIRIATHSSTPLTISEHLVDEEGRRITGMPLVDLQDGDILITKNSRFLGWRNGHAALVVDAEKGILLEAVMLGTATRLNTVEKWSAYPSFQVLRLRDEYAQKEAETQNTVNGAKSLPQKIAAYATKNLTEVPYHLHAGIWERLSPTKIKTVQAADSGEIHVSALKGTHCAHLVWYAYKQFGIDLDSDGGLIVTPCDIQNSDYLEVVQSYGY